MRALSLLRARRDMAEMLLRQGRLGDVQMLNFFGSQLQHEAADPAEAAAATSKPVAADAATPTDAAAAASPSAQEISARARRAAFDRFHARHAAVTAKAAKQPLSWLADVYGEKEWTCTPAEGAPLAVARTADSKSLTLTGRMVAVGAVGSAAESACVLVRVPEEASDDLAPLVAARLSLSAPGVRVTKIPSGLSLELDRATAALLPAVVAEEVAAGHHVLFAAACSGILSRLAEIGALHATHAVRYDALLIRNPAVQQRLAQIECARFAVDCLGAYVAGDGELEEGEVPAAAERLEMPAVEAMLLNYYAEMMLMSGLDDVWEVVRGTPLDKAVPHRSKASLSIDYPYIAELFRLPKRLLSSAHGSKELHAVTTLVPLLRRSRIEAASGAFQNPLPAMLGMSAGRIRLLSPHVNLRMVATVLEKDIQKLLDMIAAQKDREEPAFVLSVAEYMSELMASLAVVYRCSASLNVDEDGKGHREWLLAQAFCASSAARRQTVLADFKMASAANQILRKASDLDNYSTHPLELMNASAQRAVKGGGATKKTAAKAEEAA